MVTLELLKSIKAFSNMDEEQLLALKPHCETLEYRQDERLFREGDDAQHLWYIVEGEVDLRFEMPSRSRTHPERTVASVGVKEPAPEAKVLGWSCFIPPFRMRLSAYCITDRCRIVRIPKSVLTDLFEKDPAMGYQFLSYLITVVGYRFQQFQDHVARNLGEDLMSGW